MAADDAVLPVHGDAGKVADVLVGTGQLVEQGGLAGVLIADQREGQFCSIRQGIAAALGMETAFLTETGVFRGALRDPFFFGGFVIQRDDADLFRFRQAQGKFVPVDPKLHGVSHGRQLDHRHFRAGDHAHVQEVLAQGAFAADGFNDGAPAGFQFIQVQYKQLPSGLISHECSLLLFTTVSNIKQMISDHLFSVCSP